MKYWNIPVTPHLDNVVEKAVELNAHVSKSDFIRCAVREKLANMGLKKNLKPSKGLNIKMTAEAATHKNQGIHSPLLRFRKRAHCQECPLHNACLSNKTLEKHCILALIADSLHMNAQLNASRGVHP